jgi:hypothetical protein
VPRIASAAGRLVPLMSLLRGGLHGPAVQSNVLKTGTNGNIE